MANLPHVSIDERVATVKAALDETLTAIAEAGEGCPTCVKCRPALLESVEIGVAIGGILVKLSTSMAHHDDEHIPRFVAALDRAIAQLLHARQAVEVMVVVSAAADAMTRKVHRWRHR